MDSQVVGGTTSCMTKNQTMKVIDHINNIVEGKGLKFLISRIEA